MKTLEWRIEQAEAVLRPLPGCAVCRTWDGSVVGDESDKRSRPEVCPACGRVVPVRRLVMVVGLDLDRLSLNGRRSTEAIGIATDTNEADSGGSTSTSSDSQVRY